MKSLEGKIALVTGASQGIGASIAKTLANYGANIVVNYFQSEQYAQEVCKYVQSKGQQAFSIRGDVTDSKMVKHMVDEIGEKFGRIDILVNNAGHNPLRSIMEISDEDWDWVLDLNLKSFFICTKAILPGMLDRADGRIINISSISGQRGGNSCDVDYSSAKAGIFGFTRALAKWAAPRGIIVNAVAPGYIETESMRSNLGMDVRQKLTESIPLKRLGHPDEIAEVVAFLAGPGASYIVGEVVTVNGGAHIA